MWERACSRRGHISQHPNRLIHRLRERARPHMFRAQTSGSLSVRLLRLVNLVEHATVVEEFRLRGFPAAEVFIDGDQLQFRELIGVLGGDILVPWTIEVFRRDFLTRRAVQVLEVGCRRSARCPFSRRSCRLRPPAARRGSTAKARRCRICRRRHLLSAPGRLRFPRPATRHPDRC